MFIDVINFEQIQPFPFAFESSSYSRSSSTRMVTFPAEFLRKEATFYVKIHKTEIRSPFMQFLVRVSTRQSKHGQHKGWDCLDNQRQKRLPWDGRLCLQGKKTRLLRSYSPNQPLTTTSNSAPSTCSDWRILTRVVSKLFIQNLRRR